MDKLLELMNNDMSVTADNINRKINKLYTLKIQYAGLKEKLNNQHTNIDCEQYELINNNEEYQGLKTTAQKKKAKYDTRELLKEIHKLEHEKDLVKADIDILTTWLKLTMGGME